MMKRWSGIALVLAFFASMTPAAADVLCKKRNGILTSRTTCKRRETAVDPGSLGLVGPTGATGASGPGARWALVDIDGTILSQSGGISVETALLSAGIVYLNFGSNQDGKNVQVTSTCTAADCNFRGGTSGAICGSSSAGYMCDASVDDTSHVIVFTRNSADTATESHAFFVAVF